MSRQRDKIRKTAAKHNIKLDSIEWEPIGVGAEKCGPSGGWFVSAKDVGEIFVAYHHEEICEQIKNYALHGIALSDERTKMILEIRKDNYNERIQIERLGEQR